MSANARRSRRPPRHARTSWEQVAGWYDGWVGPHGSRYHQRIAIPTALDLLDLRAGEEVLDVGAGQGVLAPHVVATGARYTGVDASARLIALARRRHGREGRFVVADARRLDAVPALRGARFDAAVFLLSIQDMDPLPAVLASVSRLLRPAGRVVVVMTHPCFRQPRHSGWGVDESRKLTFRRIDAYLTLMAVPMKAIGDGAPTRSFHRPLSSYVTELAVHGFAIDAMVEPPDLSDDERPGPRRPSAYANPEIPLFLALRARR